LCAWTIANIGAAFSTQYVIQCISSLNDPVEARKASFVARITSIFIGLLPLPFTLYVPGLLKTIFFARALRTSVAIVAIFMFYLPYIGSTKAPVTGLIGAFIGTTIWFIAGDPWGIDNIYVGVAIPAIVMVGDWLIRKMA
jgi:SSS family solute:Na+ symporter